MKDEDCKLEEGTLESYIGTALWSTTAEEAYDGEFLDEFYSFEDVDEDDLEILRKELCLFIKEHFGLVTSTDRNTDISHFVHNVWLTRNGHGAGFWDGDYANGEALTEACEKLGEVCLYAGDDGKIYKF